MVKVYVLNFALLFFINKCCCELYTSVEQLSKLIDTHKSVLDSLTKYVETEEKRIKILNSYIKIFKTEHRKAKQDTEKYLGNPINLFTLVKRLTSDFDYLKMVATMATEYEWDSTLLYPKEKDMAGAALGISRLQDTYKLNVTTMSQGLLYARLGPKNIMSEKFSAMAASDCFNLGLMLYKHDDFTVAALWFIEALHKFSFEEKIINPFSATDIIAHIVKCYHYSKNESAAAIWAKKLYEINPNEVKNDAIARYYTENVPDEEWLHEDKLELKQPLKKKQIRTTAWKMYAELCRNEIEVPTKISSKLHCSYLKRNSFLLLAPIKMEQILLEPDVFLYHDVLSDDEIATLKKVVRRRLKRALVHSNNEKVPTESRISKSAWLDDSDLDIVAKISQRIEDFTGMNTDSAEDLQIANYGVGGQYNPHFDFDRTGKHYGEIGNRIATVLFYMSDVLYGGATVFTKLGLSVAPVKGTALFWMNLLPNGEGDNRTLHAACPVMFGNKWVANKWLHQAGHEFTHPCPVVQEPLVNIHFKK